MKNWFSLEARVGIRSAEAVANALGHTIAAVRVSRPDASVAGKLPTSSAARPMAMREDMHPATVATFHATREYRAPMKLVAEIAGVKRGTFKAWKCPASGNEPSLVNLSAVLAVLGMELQLRPLNPTAE